MMVYVVTRTCTSDIYNPVRLAKGPPDKRWLGMVGADVVQIEATQVDYKSPAHHS